MTVFFAPYKYSYLLTYLLTYLRNYFIVVRSHIQTAQVYPVFKYLSTAVEMSYVIQYLQ